MGHEFGTGHDFPEKDEALSHCCGGVLCLPRVQRATWCAIG